MSIISHFFNRLKFRRTITSDESLNVVDGIAKAQKLYKKLCVKAHPDHNQDRIEVAEDLMKRIVANKFNYEILRQLESEINEKLG